MWNIPREEKTFNGFMTSLFPPLSLSLRFLLLFRSVFTSEKQASRMRKSNAKVKLIRREWEKFLAQNYKSDTLFE